MRKTLGTMLRFAMVAVVCGTVSAQSQISCPNMPAAMTDVNRQVRSDVQATVGSLSKLKLGELVARTEVETQALLAKYPNVDRLLTVQMMAATHCSILVSSNLPATEKGRKDGNDSPRRPIDLFTQAAGRHSLKATNHKRHRHPRLRQDPSSAVPDRRTPSASHQMLKTCGSSIKPLAWSRSLAARARSTPIRSSVPR